MQGQQDSQRVLFDTVDLESLIPDDHLLRQINAKIDFDFIYEVTKGLYCADNGRSSVDPVLFFKMQLISYLYGMKSDRELCREVHLNLAYRWFCRLGLQTGARHECPVLPERIEYQRQGLGLPIQEVIADLGYGRGPTYAQLRQQKIRRYIPLHDANTGRGKLTPSDFKYERRKDSVSLSPGLLPLSLRKD